MLDLNVTVFEQLLRDKLLLMGVMEKMDREYHGQVGASMLRTHESHLGYWWWRKKVAFEMGFCIVSLSSYFKRKVWLILMLSLTNFAPLATYPNQEVSLVQKAILSMDDMAC
jgi:hypothetical protein